MLAYNPRAWFWIIAGRETQAYSSAIADFIPLDDARFQAFRAAGGIATTIPSCDELRQVLEDAGAPDLTTGLAFDTKEVALARLAAYRYQRETAGIPFTTAAATRHRVATDRDSQAKINAAYTMARDGLLPQGLVWKMADGSFPHLTAADVTAMALEVAGHVAGCFAREAELAPQVAAAPNTDITTGWPA